MESSHEYVAVHGWPSIDDCRLMIVDLRSGVTTLPTLDAPERTVIPLTGFLAAHFPSTTKQGPVDSPVWYFINHQSAIVNHAECVSIHERV